MLTVPIRILCLYVYVVGALRFLYVFNVLKIPVTHVNVRVMTVCALIADLEKNIFEQQHFDDEAYYNNLYCLHFKLRLSLNIKKIIY